jgi:hypothetical protein
MDQNSENVKPANNSFKGVFTENVYRFLLFSLCPLLFYQPAFQNDTYWLINTGKYIMNHGFPGVEPFTMHQGLNLIVQQWLSTILFFRCFQMAGPMGIHILILVIYAVILFLVYRLALLMANSKKLVASYITAFVGVCIYSFMVPRPQVFSLLIFITEVLILEYYTRNPKWFAVVSILPLLAILLINLHAAMWPMFFLFCAPYLIDSFKFRVGRVEGQGYRKAPLIAGILASIVASFINPYSYRAMIYIFSSYGNDSINRYVDEMSSPDFKNFSGVMIFALVLTIVLIYNYVQSATRLRYALLTIGTLYMGLASGRSFSFFIIFGMAFLAYHLRNINISSSIPPKRRAVLFGIAVFALGIGRISRLKDVGLLEENYKPVEAVQYILKNVYPSKLRLYNDYNTGGYLEFSGIRTFIDSRAEVFTKKLNGKRDIFQDYVDMLNGKLYYKDFASKYAFTHFLVYKDSLLDNCLRNDHNYNMLFHDKKYVLFDKAF